MLRYIFSSLLYCIITCSMIGCSAKDIGNPQKEEVIPSVESYIQTHFAFKFRGQEKLDHTYSCGPVEIIKFDIGKQVERIDQSGLKQQVKPVLVQSTQRIQQDVSFYRSVHREWDLLTTTEFLYYIDEHGQRHLDLDNSKSNIQIASSNEKYY